jgi:hypothetical protein
MLKLFRSYISSVRNFADFEVSDAMQTFVQEDFVRERSGNQAALTPDDLHSLLVTNFLIKRATKGFFQGHI